MPRLLDLFCCQGGASRGYADAGWDVVGVDIEPQPRYPFRFIRADALELLQTLVRGDWWLDGSTLIHISHFDAVHASPPCQAHTRAWKLNKREHPKLIAPTRSLLDGLGLPYVIENVEEARDELIDPVMLCGESFELETYRHRLFETNWPLTVPDHLPHLARTTKMGRPYTPGEYMHIVGNFSGVDQARRIMAMPWANRDGLREAIPPAYTEWIGRQLLARTHVSIDPEPDCKHGYYADQGCPWCAKQSTEIGRFAVMKPTDAMVAAGAHMIRDDYSTYGDAERAAYSVIEAALGFLESTE